MRAAWENIPNFEAGNVSKITHRFSAVLNILEELTYDVPGAFSFRGIDLPCFEDPVVMNKWRVQE